MAKVTWSAGIDNVSGALSKPGANPQHKCEKMLLATHRTAPTQSPDCNRIYLRKKSARSTPLTLDEVAARNRFKSVAGMVKARQQDPSKITQDQLDFIAQKNTADGLKTMKAYLWSVCGEEYDQNH